MQPAIYGGQPEGDPQEDLNRALFKHNAIRSGLVPQVQAVVNAYDRNAASTPSSLEEFWGRLNFAAGFATDSGMPMQIRRVTRWARIMLSLVQTLDDAISKHFGTEAVDAVSPLPMLFRPPEPGDLPEMLSEPCEKWANKMAAKGGLSVEEWDCICMLMHTMRDFLKRTGQEATPMQWAFALLRAAILCLPGDSRGLGGSGGGEDGGGDSPDPCDLPSADIRPEDVEIVKDADGYDIAQFQPYVAAFGQPGVFYPWGPPCPLTGENLRKYELWREKEGLPPLNLAPIFRTDKFPSGR